MDLHSDIERESVSQLLSMYLRMRASFGALGGCANAVKVTSRRKAASTRFGVMVIMARLKMRTKIRDGGQPRQAERTRRITSLHACDPACKWRQRDILHCCCGVERGVIGCKSLDGGAGDACLGEVEGDGPGFSGEVHCDDDRGAGAGRSHPCEDVGIGGVEHRHGAVVQGGVAASQGDDPLEPFKLGVGIFGFNRDVDGLVVRGNRQPGLRIGAETGLGTRHPTAWECVRRRDPFLLASR